MQYIPRPRRPRPHIDNYGKFQIKLILILRAGAGEVWIGLKTLNFLRYLQTVYQEELETLRQWLPEAEDVEGAAEAIVRLQRTYSLSALQLVNVQESSSSRPGAAPDCFHIGQQLYCSRHWAAAREWLLIALSFFQSDNITDATNMSTMSVGDRLNEIKFFINRVLLTILHLRNQRLVV